MQEVKRSRSKKARGLDQKCSRKSIKSNQYLQGSVTQSTFGNVKSSRPSTAKSVGRVPGRRSSEDEPLVRLSHAAPSELPKNVAVHFASFYQNENPSLPHSSFTWGEKRSVGRNTSIGNSPKMEFTRQMVYKLENSAGTRNYGREVSALLDETVESPGFDLKPPPIDNCSPGKKSEDYYPLWYKDPNKMPSIKRSINHFFTQSDFTDEKECSDRFDGKTTQSETGVNLKKKDYCLTISRRISREHFRELKDKYTVGMVKKLEEEMRKVEESIVSDSSESEVDIETETETDEGKKAEEEEEEEDGSGRDCGSKSIASSAVVEDGKKVEKRCSWSSQNSCETETSEDDEDEDSLNWETEVDDEENHKVVALGTRRNSINTKNQISSRFQRSIVSSFL